MRTALWIFGYGSLVWRPAFAFAERRTAWIGGFARYEGSFTTGSLAAEYRINRNFAVGAGYAMNDYNLDVTKGKARGSFDYQFDGPMIYVTGGF